MLFWLFLFACFLALAIGTWVRHRRRAGDFFSVTRQGRYL